MRSLPCALLLAAVVLASGCLLQNPGKADLLGIPEAKEFFDNNPGTTFEVRFFNAGEVQKAHLVQPRCGTLPEKNHWRLVLVSGDMNREIWFEADSRKVTCDTWREDLVEEKVAPVFQHAAFSLKDDLNLQEFEKAEVTFSSLAVKRKDAKEWEELGFAEKKFDFAALSGKTVLWGEKDLDLGTYTAARFSIKKIELQSKKGRRDSLSLPSRELVLSLQLEGTGIGPLYISLDLDLVKSLQGGPGSWQFSPLLQAQVHRYAFFEKKDRNSFVEVRLYRGGQVEFGGQEKFDQAFSLKGSRQLSLQDLNALQARTKLTQVKEIRFLEDRIEVFAEVQRKNETFTLDPKTRRLVEPEFQPGGSPDTTPTLSAPPLGESKGPFARIRVDGTILEIGQGKAITGLQEEAGLPGSLGLRLEQVYLVESSPAGTFSLLDANGEILSTADARTGEDLTVLLGKGGNKAAANAIRVEGFGYAGISCPELQGKICSAGKACGSAEVRTQDAESCCLSACS